MKNKIEKGFKRIKIVDANYENLEQMNEIDTQRRFQLIAIFSIIFLFLLLLVLLGIYLSYGNNKKRVHLGSPNKKSVNNKLKEVFNNNVNNYYKKNYENDTNEKEVEKYDIEQILKYAEKKVQMPEINSTQNIKISIIIMNNKKTVDTKLEELYESIESQSFPDKEIIINKNDMILSSNFNANGTIFKESTLVEYKIDTGKIMQRYDLVNMAKGEYILFIQSDDKFSQKRKQLVPKLLIDAGISIDDKFSQTKKHCFGRDCKVVDKTAFDKLMQSLKHPTFISVTLFGIVISLR